MDEQPIKYFPILPKLVKIFLKLHYTNFYFLMYFLLPIDNLFIFVKELTILFYSSNFSYDLVSILYRYHIFIIILLSIRELILNLFHAYDLNYLPLLLLCPVLLSEV
jgi:hypothetical protein